MHIVSASRRTDIPAFYSEWLMNRLREGYARVPNPFNPRQVSTVDLRPEQVACLVFWTKDPRPMLSHLEELEQLRYRYYFQVTVTGLPRLLEPGVPESAATVAAIREIARSIGRDRVIWRFDPILLSRLSSPDDIIRTFGILAQQLTGSVSTAIISFARDYPKVKARLKRMSLGTEVRFLTTDCDEKLRLAAGLADAARPYGITVRSCADPADLTAHGVAPAACIDANLINRLFGLDLAPAKHKGQRGECRCTRSVDIGMYGTCLHNCSYCYASCDAALAGGRIHNPASGSLLEGAAPEPCR